MRICNIARSTIYKIFETTCNVLLCSLDFDGFPHSEEDCSVKSQQLALSRRCQNPLHGCVGALDGEAVRIRKPRFSTVQIQKGFTYDAS